MPKEHPMVTSPDLTKMANQTLTINPSLAIDRDLTLNWIDEYNPTLDFKDISSKWFKCYRGGSFYVKNENTEEIYAKPPNLDVFTLLDEREIRIGWEDFERSMRYGRKKHNDIKPFIGCRLSEGDFEIGRFYDAEQVVGKLNFLEGVIFRETSEWCTLTPEKGIQHIAPEQLFEFLFGYHGNLPILGVEFQRRLYPQELVRA